MPVATKPILDKEDLKKLWKGELDKDVMKLIVRVLSPGFKSDPIPFRMWCSKCHAECDWIGLIKAVKETPYYERDAVWRCSKCRAPFILPEKFLKDMMKMSELEIFMAFTGLSEKEFWLREI